MDNLVASAGGLKRFISVVKLIISLGNAYLTGLCFCFALHLGDIDSAFASAALASCHMSRTENKDVEDFMLFVDKTSFQSQNEFSLLLNAQLGCRP